MEGRRGPRSNQEIVESGSASSASISRRISLKQSRDSRKAPPSTPSTAPDPARSNQEIVESVLVLVPDRLNFDEKQSRDSRKRFAVEVRLVAVARSNQEIVESKSECLSSFNYNANLKQSRDSRKPPEQWPERRKLQATINSLGSNQEIVERDQPVTVQILGAISRKQSRDSRKPPSATASSGGRACLQKQSRDSRKLRVLGLQVHRHGAEAIKR